ncbi:MAG: methylenetetrahydrofolate reductase [NAD(P)H] [Chromatiales bacterium]|jgi:methylenetetrahydrofolate reductase (NADPH)
MTTQAKTYSFELFPPKTETGFDKLKTTVTSLNELGPEFFSVTYGAGGSTQDRTFATVDWLREQNIETAPHLSCIGSSSDEILDILNRYRNQGIRRVVALRGDLPSGAGLGSLGELNYANELVALMRADFGNEFHIEVAAYPEVHPQSPSASSDLKNFKRKVDAGASSAITQYFYNADAYFAFLDSCQALGIDIPIVPGIMPITNYTQLARFSDACGAEIPRWIRKRLQDFGDDLDSIRAFGEDMVTAMCQRLLDNGAPGLHFYTMNQAAPTLAIWQRLGLS